MTTKPILLAILTLAILTAAAFGQANNSSVWQTPGNIIVPGQVVMCINGSTLAVSCSTTTPLPVNQTTPAAGSAAAGYPLGATPIQNSATGTTAGATATLTGTAAQFTYLCGIVVGAGTATTAITITITTTGLVSNLTIPANAPATAATATAGPIVSQTFTPCLKSSAVNTNITVVAGALGTGGVSQAVNAWGFTQ